MTVIHNNPLVYIISVDVMKNDLQALRDFEKKTGKKLPVVKFIPKPWPEDTFSISLRSDLEIRKENEKLQESAKEKDKIIKKLEQATVDLIAGFCEEMNEILNEIEECTEIIKSYLYICKCDFNLSDYMYFLGNKDVEEFIEMFKSLNRQIHTLKGNSGILGLSNLNVYCHKLEELTLEISKGNLFLNAEASEIIGKIPIVLNRVLEDLSSKFHDDDITVDDELKEIDKCKDALFGIMGGKQVNLQEIPKRDMGNVRKRKKEIKISLSLEKYDLIIDKFQELSQQFFAILSKANIEESNAYASATEYLNDLIYASQSLIDLTRYTRMVKDMEKSFQKEIDFEIKRNTALARPDIWDTCHNALVHMVRNAVDHGIEDPMIREQLGKPPKGSISLEIYDDNKNIYVVLEDDGGGIDEEKIAKIALKKNIVTKTVLSGMTKAEKQKLIFKPGFSTKQNVTDVSGRGVGMDVVINGIEKKLGGSVHLYSEKNTGTKIVLEIPKTNTISECILFGDNKNIFAIHRPEKVSYVSFDKNNRTFLPDKSHVYDNSNEIYPIVDILKLLGSGDSEPTTIIEICSDAKINFGLLVPKIIDHKILRVEREDKFVKFHCNGSKDIRIFGYSLYNNNPIPVLDIESLSESMVMGKN